MRVEPLVSGGLSISFRDRRLGRGGRSTGPASAAGAEVSASSSGRASGDVPTSPWPEASASAPRFRLPPRPLLPRRRRFLGASVELSSPPTSPASADGPAPAADSAASSDLGLAVGSAWTADSPASSAVFDRLPPRPRPPRRRRLRTGGATSPPAAPASSGSSCAPRSPGSSGARAWTVPCPLPPTAVALAARDLPRPRPRPPRRLRRGLGAVASPSASGASATRSVSSVIRCGSFLHRGAGGPDPRAGLQTMTRVRQGGGALGPALFGFMAAKGAGARPGPAPRPRAPIVMHEERPCSGADHPAAALRTNRPGPAGRGRAFPCLARHVETPDLARASKPTDRIQVQRIPTEHPARGAFGTPPNKGRVPTPCLHQ
jgi:hypothetical protein